MDSLISKSDSSDGSFTDEESTHHLNALSDDALGHVFSFLPFQQMLLLRAVSRRFFSVSDLPWAGWQRHYETLLETFQRIFRARSDVADPTLDRWGLPSRIFGSSPKKVPFASILESIEAVPDRGFRQKWILLQGVATRINRCFALKELNLYGHEEETECCQCSVLHGLNLTCIVIVPILAMVLSGFCVVLLIVRAYVRMTSVAQIVIGVVGCVVSGISVVLFCSSPPVLFLVNDLICGLIVRKKILQRRWELFQSLPEEAWTTWARDWPSAPRGTGGRLGFRLLRFGLGYSVSALQNHILADLVTSTLPVVEVDYLIGLLIPSSMFVSFLWLLVGKLCLFALIPLNGFVACFLIVSLVVQIRSHDLRLLLYHTGYRKSYWELVLVAGVSWIACDSLSLLGVFVADFSVVARWTIGGFLCLLVVVLLVLVVVSAVCCCDSGWLNMNGGGDWLAPESTRWGLVYQYRMRSRRMCGCSNDDSVGQVYVLFGLWCLPAVLCMLSFGVALCFMRVPVAVSLGFLFLLLFFVIVGVPIMYFYLWSHACHRSACCPSTRRYYR